MLRKLRMSLAKRSSVPPIEEIEEYGSVLRRCDKQTTDSWSESRFAASTFPPRSARELPRLSVATGWTKDTVLSDGLLHNVRMVSQVRLENLTQEYPLRATTRSAHAEDSEAAS